jgi:threonine dehydrogenase-like Zn-dependent dehydrogenase
VTVAAPSAFKLDRAKELGIDQTFLMDRADLAGDAAKLKAASGGFDVVVDATGAAAVSQQCVPLTRSGGTVMFYGVTEPEDLVRVSPYDVFRREITIKGSRAPRGSSRTASSSTSTLARLTRCAATGPCTRSSSTAGKRERRLDAGRPRT